MTDNHFFLFRAKQWINEVCSKRILVLLDQNTVSAAVAVAGDPSGLRMDLTGLVA
jgi:hypothetical protein